MTPSAARSLCGALFAALAATAGASSFDKGGIVAVGAAEAGQGGAVVARAEGPEALWWNPAGIQRRADFEVAGGYGSVLGGKDLDLFAAHRGRLPELDLGYGLGYRQLQATGAFRLSEATTVFALAFPFSEDGRLGLGAAFKLYQSQLDVPGGEAGGFGLDLGARWQPELAEGRLALGAAVMDFQSSLKWAAGIRADPVQLFQGGLAWSFDELTSVELDYEFVADPQFSPRSHQGFKFGAERFFGLKALGLKRLAALRVGYLQSSALAASSLGGQFTLGLGLQWSGLRLDYAYLQDVSALGETHRLAGGLRFGALGPAAPPAPTPSRTPSPARAVRLSLKVEPALLRPAQPGASLAASLNVEQGAAQVKAVAFRVLDASGEEVFALRRDGLPEALRWDGRGRDGALVREGGYRARVEALDAAGAVLSGAEAAFSVLRAEGKLRLIPESDIFAPIPQSVRPAASLAAGYDGKDALRWTLTVRPAKGGAALRVLTGRALPAKLSWDGKTAKGARAPDGPYQLELRLATGASGELRAEAKVEVDSRRPTLGWEVSPRLFEPREGAGGVSVLPTYDGAFGIPARWSVAVEDISGRAVKTFTGKGVPPERIVWNGSDEQGAPVAPGGIYHLSYSVEMESGAVARLPRLSLGSRLEEPKQPFRVPLQTLRFNPGDEAVALEDYRALKEAAAAVKKYSSDYVLQVIGYCDASESAPGEADPIELSTLRAKAVRDYLVESEQLESVKVRAMGYGVPAQGGDAISDEGKQKNRRVEIILYAK